MAEGKPAFQMPAQLLKYTPQREYSETHNHGAAFANVMNAVRKCGSYQPGKGMDSLDAMSQANAPSFPSEELRSQMDVTRPRPTAVSTCFRPAAV